MRTLLVASLVVPLASSPDITPCTQQADLSPVALDVGDHCGRSVSSEGSRVVIGAPDHNGKGAVFIFSYDGVSWDLDCTIIPNQISTGDQFGCSVSVNGALLAVGALGDDAAATNAGAVYILEEVSSTQWSVQEKLLPGDPSNTFGVSVSLWDDTVVVGEPLPARVHVFRQSGNDWIEEGDGDGAPIDSPGSGIVATSFGGSVALYQDTLLIGDDDFTLSAPNSLKIGRAYIYTREGDEWDLAQDISNPEAVNDAEHFGEAVALHGRWAAISAPQYDVGEESGQGIVHMYRVNEEGYYEYDENFLMASDGDEGDSFGKAVALRSGTLIVGAPTRDVDSVPYAGVAYQFSLVDGDWTELGTYDPGDQAYYDQVGASVAIGSYAALGAPGDPTYSTTGRALVWSLCLPE